MDILGAGAYNVSGIVRDGKLEGSSYGRGKHLLVSRFLSSVIGQDPPEAVITVGDGIWDVE